MADKQPLSISVCDVDGDGNVKDRSNRRGSKAFVLMLNPTSYSYGKEISYSKDATVGKVGSESKFQGVGPESLSFDFLVDGTGAVDPDKKFNDVTKQLKDLSTIVYDYNGTKHEPNIVKVLWGSRIFIGRLTSFKTDYTLFKPNGYPLRAKVSLAFKSYMSPKEEELRKNNSSPDMSHRIVFKEGDTLPLLCYKIYKDSTYYAEVAGYNKLVDFRNIKPGTEIAFPPLR